MGTNPLFPVPVQMQCERFFLKPYNPFFLVQVLVPETASVNTPSEPLIKVSMQDGQRNRTGMILY